MPRPRKFEEDMVVQFRRDGFPPIEYGVVVGYKDDVKSHRYIVLRTDSLGRYPRLPAVQVDTYSDVMRDTGRRSHRPGVVYRDIERGQHSCDCGLCPYAYWK